MDRIDQDLNAHQADLDDRDIAFENNKYVIQTTDSGRDALLGIFWEDFLGKTDEAMKVWRLVQYRSSRTIERAETEEELSLARSMNSNDFAIIELFKSDYYMDLAIKDQRLC